MNKKFLFYLSFSQIFKLDFNYDQIDLDNIEILEANCQILNEFIANKLNAIIRFEKEQNNEIEKFITNNQVKYYLKIDSSEFCSDNLVDMNCIEINLFLEIKYTNKYGLEQNLLHCFKKQVTVRFEQIVFASILNIKEKK